MVEEETPKEHHEAPKKEGKKITITFSQNTLWKVLVVVLVIVVIGLIATRNSGGGNGGGDNLPPASNKLAADLFIGYAESIGLDKETFTQCLTSGSKADKVEKELQEGIKLGITGTPGWYVNSQLISGALPASDFEAAINKPQGNLPADISLQNVNSLGPADVKITVVEYSDFQCPFCSASAGENQELIARFKARDPAYKPAAPYLRDLAKSGKIRLIYKHFPLNQIHPNAQKAAEASECAASQGNFWEYHDVLFKKQTEWEGAIAA